MFVSDFVLTKMLGNSMLLPLVLHYCGRMDVAMRRKLYNMNWMVYAKQPFGGPKQVIDYIDRYSPEFAISNHRIKKVNDGKVPFAYKDYATGGV